MRGYASIGSVQHAAGAARGSMKDLIRCVRALNDENRLLMLKLLTEKDICVCEMKEIFSLSESQVSRSMRMLMDAGFLRRWHDGKCVVYMADRADSSEHCRMLLDIVARCYNDDDRVNACRQKLQQVIADKVREQKA